MAETETTDPHDVFDAPIGGGKKTMAESWGAGDVSPDSKHPDQTLQMLVHVCHAKDWEFANGHIQEAERLAYYADLVKYVREEMQ